MLRYVLAFGIPLVLLTVGGSAAQVAQQPKPGWPDVFIHLDNYYVIYAKPVVGTGENPDVYRQKASYGWMGGRAETIEITLARDPAFKDQYAAEVLKKEKNPPKELEVNKKKAWQWDFQVRDTDVNRVAHRLVVVLDTDKVIIIDQKGFGADLVEVARMFDFAAVEKALAKPPMR